MVKLSCCEFCTREFQKRNFFFDLDQPHLMATSQLGGFQRAYILYRSVFLVYQTYVLLHDILTSRLEHHYVLYMDHWYYILRGIYSILTLLCAIHLYRVDEMLTTTPIFYKITWIMYYMAQHFTFNISSILVYCTIGDIDISIGADVPIYEYYLSRTIYHFDLFVHAIPARLLHFYIGLIAILAYNLSILIVWLANGTVVYEITDWGSDPTTAALWFVLQCLNACFISHTSIFFWYWLRVTLYKYVCRRLLPSLEPSLTSMYGEDIATSTVIDLSHPNSLQDVNSLKSQET